jgi:hypothetical protein
MHLCSQGGFNGTHPQPYSLKPAALLIAAALLLLPLAFGMGANSTIDQYALAFLSSQRLIHEHANNNLRPVPPCERCSRKTRP